MAGAPAATVIVHGGFDSFIEEFVRLLGAMRDTGFDVKSTPRDVPEGVNRRKKVPRA